MIGTAPFVPRDEDLTEDDDEGHRVMAIVWYVCALGVVCEQHGDVRG